ncbi:hypothetical protein MICRO80W_130039 [Micrococcus luteus]|nr:hypothetical protein MICRO80W_130039 [Micrococcus luteus]
MATTIFETDAVTVGAFERTFHSTLERTSPR